MEKYGNETLLLKDDLGNDYLVDTKEICGEDDDNEI